VNACEAVIGRPLPGEKLAGGILVFRDPIGIGALAIAARAIAFGLVIAGEALMPAPVRAGRGGG
jgi:hypothetical protein